MSQVNSYKVAREGSQFGKLGTLVPLTANQAASFERTGELVFDKAGEPPLPKGAKTDAVLRARITQLESDLQAALAGSPDPAALKAAQDAQAEAERLLASSKEANALADAELSKVQLALTDKQAELDARTAELVEAQTALAARDAELADARADLTKAAAEFDHLDAQFNALGITQDEEGNLHLPVAAAPEEAAGT